MKEGYALLPASWPNRVPDAGSCCDLCPEEDTCTGPGECTAGFGLVWVPDHIHAIWLMNADDKDKKTLEWRLKKVDEEENRGHI